MPLKSFVKEKPLEYTAPIKVREDSSDYKQKLERKCRKTTLLKRIPLHKLMDLKVDYAFKQLFGNEKNKDITVVFLNAILQKSGRDSIKDITFTNTEAGGEYVDDKQSRLDLLVITEAGERINVEIQFTNKYNMIKRSIYYWAGTYRSPLQKRMSYQELQPVITINIMNFTIFDRTNRFHTSHHLYEDKEKFKLTDVMELHFVEMPKLIKAWKEGKLNPWNDLLARWLLMLGMVDHRNNKVYEGIYKELEAIAMADKMFRNAFQSWEELSMTQEEYLAYESRLKRINDEEAAQREAELRLKKAIEKVTKKATEKAREEKEAIARRLLEKGMEIQEVAEITKISEDRIIEIQRGFKE
ncbi:Rpn family recombination-promoting nuclease/putative transposase [Oceanobacillus senegalensis]|uniref:Rpn family recombination-promoting nuclease/putative transposase n=1 Tax=Oceanobacillus senegalensis TaxID=1936063 RepID=UPI000A304D6E|nr:Rpn family recombination-promoting nuclease/putative transposase [Oceanobacillus senegalensis]